MAAESKKSSKAAKPIADVAQPGKTPPSESSRPIITHRSLMKDPMVVEAESAAPAADEVPVSPAEPAKSVAAKTTTAGERKIQPITESPVVPEEATETPKAEAEAAPAETKEPVEPEEQPAESEDTSANEASPDKPSHDAEEAEQVRHDNEVQKLIESKKYFLPVNAVERRRSKRFVALGILVSLLLAASWANIALDAGLIEIPGVKPVTHFFST